MKRDLVLDGLVLAGVLAVMVRPLVVALVALVLTLAGWKPTRKAYKAPEPPPRPPVAVVQPKPRQRPARGKKATAVDALAA